MWGLIHLSMHYGSRTLFPCFILHNHFHKCSNELQYLKIRTKKPNNSIKKWAEDLYRYFLKEDIQMSNRHMKQCSISLIFREVHIKTTMVYDLTHVRMAIITKSTNNVGEGMIKSELCCVFVWMQISAATMENTYNPMILLLAIYTETTKTLTQKDTCTQMFITELFIMVKTWEQPK